jgi:hypothetical protein
MIARSTAFAVAAFLALGLAASAQNAKQPQTPPNPGAAEAQPSTVKGPGGYTTAPAPATNATPATYGSDPASGNGFTASPPLGPQQNPGVPINRTVHYIAGDYIAPPLVWNAFAGPSKGENYRSYAGRAGFEVSLGQYDVYLGADARKYTYPTRTGLVTGIGTQGRAFVPSFSAVDYDGDVRAGLKVAGPRLYGVVSYLTRGTNTGEPREHGIGYGIEKLPDLDQNFSLHGSVLFYPNVGARYAINGAGSNGVSYREVRYLIGASIQPHGAPVFLDAGFLGDRSRVRTDAPVGFNHQGPYVGLGIHF